MMPLTLGAVTLPEYHRALVSDHWVDISVQLLDLEHYYIADMSEDFYEGQINIDITGEATRNLSLKILDPLSSYGLDSRNPQGGALYYDRMIRVVYTVYTWWMANPVSAVVFCGPITTMNRDGLFINLEAKGKETLALGQIWNTRTYLKGRTKLSILLDLCNNVLGEDRYDLPRYPEILKAITADKTLGREAQVWPYMQSLASSAGLNLFYDGRGVLRLRQTSSNSVYTFRTGVGGSVVTDPQIGYEDEFKNKIWGIGGIPSGATKPIEASVQAPSSHPLSPQALGRKGKNFYQVEKVENDNFRTTTSLKAYLTKILNQRLIQAVSTTADTLVIPHLDPYDFVTIQNEAFSNIIQLRQFSIPLGVDGNNSIGVVKNVSKRSIPNRLRRTSRRV